MLSLQKFYEKNMRNFLIAFLLATFAAGVSAQTASKIRLLNAGSGKVTVVRNKARATINLSREVAGCGYANAATKKNFKDCAAPSAEFHLIDATVKNNQTYLLIASEAMGNCNVCGQCGADESFALIWLKLDRNLRVLDKKGVPIDYCRFDIDLISAVVDFKEETQDESLNLKFKDDRLEIDFEKKTFEANSERSYYEFSHLEYNRKTPEKGFVIKTERREKSSVPEQ